MFAETAQLLWKPFALLLVTAGFVSTRWSWVQRARAKREIERIRRTATFGIKTEEEALEVLSGFD